MRLNTKHPETKPGEVFLGNINVKENGNHVPRKLQHIKSLRLGFQSYCSKGESLKQTEYAPMFISELEKPLYIEWLNNIALIESVNKLPKGFSLQGNSARNPDKTFGGEVFFDRSQKRGWCYIPFNPLIKSEEGLSTPDEAFERFAEAVEQYKLLKHWKMTKSEWNKIHPDFKSVDDKGNKSALRNINNNTVAVPVTIVD